MPVFNDKSVQGIIDKITAELTCIGSITDKSIQGIIDKATAAGITDKSIQGIIDKLTSFSCASPLPSKILLVGYTSGEICVYDVVTNTLSKKSTVLPPSSATTGYYVGAVQLPSDKILIIFGDGKTYLYDNVLDSYVVGPSLPGTASPFKVSMNGLLMPDGNVLIADEFGGIFKYNTLTGTVSVIATLPNGGFSSGIQLQDGNTVLLIPGQAGRYGGIAVVNYGAGTVTVPIPQTSSPNEWFDVAGPFVDKYFLLGYGEKGPSLTPFSYFSYPSNELTFTSYTMPMLGQSYPNPEYMKCLKLSNGRLMLVPAASPTIDFWDMSSNAKITGPAHGVPSGNSVTFSGAVELAGGKVVLIPLHYWPFKIYDLSADSIVASLDNTVWFQSAVTLLR